jgi:hypothetical protein
VVELPAGGKPTVAVVVREADLPWSLKPSPGRAGRVRSVFQPKWLVERPPGSRTPREVWLGLGGGRNQAAVLRIDPEKRTWAAYNNPDDPKVQTFALEAPLFVSADELLSGSRVVFRAPVADAFIGRAAATLVLRPGRDDLGERPLLSFAGAVYRPGKAWYRVAPGTWDVASIGPGLQLRDAPADDDDVRYYVSGLIGPAALSKRDGLLLRFGTDPAHPLPLRPIDTGAAAGKPIPPDGTVEQQGDEVLFLKGEGTLAFRGDRLTADAAVRNPAWRSAMPLLLRRAEHARDLMRDLNEYPSERARVGLTPAQERALQAALGNGQPPPLDPAERTRLEGLMHAYRAADPATRDAAAKPLLDAAAARGRQLVAHYEAYLAAARAAVTPRQWKLLNHEEIDPTP